MTATSYSIDCSGARIEHRVEIVGLADLVGLLSDNKGVMWLK